ncbi:PREDICTED: uncharacterized protein LOC107168547 [Diuraphis noxia]|uniref:uncharacterized protein LOC107168547 n=1 Tax=Diuraphis noxia TaxID=143948 RepID=UPI000763A1E9|nr:PREDICTED: uncharacterized protein LOC107168547 [Diuraphis noxia]
MIKKTEFVKSSKGEKYLKMIKPIWHSLPENVAKKEKKRLPKEIENDLQIEDEEKEGGGLKKYSEDRIDTGTDKKSSMIERFNRTLGDKLKKVLYLNNVWISELPKIIMTYNNTYYRTIKMKPVEVNKNNENDLLNSVYNYDISSSIPKFVINDRVRLSSIVDVYRNKLKTNWSKEIFTVEKVFKSDVNYYKIKDIEGTIYEEELQLSLL